MLKLRFFGVGNGDSILIEFPNGQLGLIDSCISPKTMKPAAWEYIYDKHLAFCCMTHPHRDHYAGLLDILKCPNIKVDEFWYALSDIDEVIPTLNWVAVPDGDNSASKWRREREVGEIIDIFDWIWGETPTSFAREFTDVHYREFGDAKIIIFGPDIACWKKYKKRLVQQRNRGIPLKRKYENAISMVILIKYGQHLTWLLGDILKNPLQNLVQRHQEFLPDHVKSWGIKASILKIPHHGAKDAWFPQVSDIFTSCNKEDIIVFSAAGDERHPHPEVREYWSETGKRVYGTWAEIRESESKGIGTWALDSIADIAQPLGYREPTDIVVLINKDGLISVENESKD
jgi:beta-lactamase superfamily II metal-dependent hydrolase